MRVPGGRQNLILGRVEVPRGNMDKQTHNMSCHFTTR
jgi:hypothetical protein